MTDTSFTLSWEVPENDGGQKIIEYIVEIRESTTSSYTKLGTTETTQILVNNLIKDHIYLFKIYARNQVGISDALETEDKIIAGRRISKWSIYINLMISSNIAFKLY